jgi:hypothetical protein
MEDINNSEQPADWNGFYYTVIQGLRPGIYWSWSVRFEIAKTKKQKNQPKNDDGARLFLGSNGGSEFVHFSH